MRTTAILYGLLLAFAGSEAAAESAFQQDELRTFLTGKTYPLGDNDRAFYFHEDGRMDAIWKGQRETARWEKTADSAFRYSLKMFGGRECIRLLKRDDGSYVHVFEGKRRALSADAIKEGKSF
jgi:hypothetical protein